MPAVNFFQGHPEEYCFALMLISLIPYMAPEEYSADIILFI
jgi:hypothetical protein